MIVIEQLRKSYDGARGLDGFSLRVEQGELCGLVGPNGAGKTTLIKLLSTLLPPDGGRAQVAGWDVTVNPQEVKRAVGYMPDQPGLYQDMRVEEFLEFFANAFRLSRERRRAAVALALTRSGLAARREAFVEELSFGMKQRLFLARTLLHDPKVLLLDEPATGLDPLARIDLRRQLQELNAQGITILLSSHILADLEDICTRVAMISEGRNARDAEGNSLIVNLQPAVLPRSVYEVEVLGDAAPAAQRAAEVAGVKILEQHAAQLVLEVEGEGAQAAALLKHLVAGGIEVVSFARRAASLEDRYRQAFGGRPQ
jgi:ABC-2 type transport system ATP-binding protein